jgi:hypothetical protein
MHTMHIIASVGETKEDAYFAAEQGLACYGDGRVWDWYEMGGRWDSEIGSSCTIEGEPIPGVNQLCYSDDPGTFNQTINDAIDLRNGGILEVFQCLRGDTVSVEEVPVQFAGVPVADREGAALRISENNARDKKGWNALLACSTTDELEQHLCGNEFCLTTYKAYKALMLLVDQYCFDSIFYDMEAHTGRRRSVDDRKGCDPDHQWITVFDLHN